MKALELERTSAAKAGWVVGLLFIGLIAFMFLPHGPAPEPPPKPTPLPTLSSKLVSVGLPADPDLEALPPFFALWADRAEWKNEKAQFAYWNPVSKSYSFFFEATREGGKFRFRELSKKEAVAGKDFVEDESGNFIWMEESILPNGLPDVNIVTESPTHPFVFLREVPHGEFRARKLPAIHQPARSPVSVSVQMEQDPLSLKDAETTDAPQRDDPGKK